MDLLIETRNDGNGSELALRKMRSRVYVLEEPENVQ